MAGLFAAMVACSQEPTTAERPDRQPAAESSSTSTLLPIPAADLSNTPQEGVDQIRSAEVQVEALRGSTEAGSLELGAAHGRLGMLYHAYDFMRSAEACYLNAERSNPDNPYWPYLLAHVYRKLGELGDAISCLERSHRMQPEDLATLVWLGNLTFDANDLERSREAFATAIELDNDSASAIFGMGRVLLADGKPGEAANLLERALERAPHASRIHYPLGMAYRDLGNLERAQEHLEQAGILKPMPPDPVLNTVLGLTADISKLLLRAQVALKEDNPVAALGALEEALVKDPDNPSVKQNIGTVLATMDRFEEAKTWFEAALADADDEQLRMMILLNLGDLEMIEQKPEKAVQYYRAALDMDPEHRDAQQGLARAAVATDEVESAIAAFAVLTGTPADQPEPILALASALVRSGRYDATQRALETGARRFPRNPFFALQLAQLLATCPDDSVRDGHRSLGLIRPVATSMRSPAALSTMAMALAEIGQFEAAADLAVRAATAHREAGEERQAAAVDSQLAEYQAGRPVRMRW